MTEMSARGMRQQKAAVADAENALRVFEHNLRASTLSPARKLVARNQARREVRALRRSAIGR